ncbi:hypothetical protein OG883_32695 [Streptomyces sp. NBC_01142]|uniref:hypothetical protein n=1 Tax=Streptomyces sp. NBC_01142 TaxID=2975865 RepID=UPI00225A0516|nr:hypothetical protein [Streptomyces sp. NBC_01142]MCX4824534.1 hypothetical protein [Streptomyces sp. NBC_01142]
METFATVIVLLAMIAIGVLMIQLFSTRHDDHIVTPSSSHSRPGRGGWRRRPWHRSQK